MNSEERSYIELSPLRQNRSPFFKYGNDLGDDQAQQLPQHPNLTPTLDYNTNQSTNRSKPSDTILERYRTALTQNSSPDKGHDKKPAKSDPVNSLHKKNQVSDLIARFELKPKEKKPGNAVRRVKIGQSKLLPKQVAKLNDSDQNESDIIESKEAREISPNDGVKNRAIIPHGAVPLPHLQGALSTLNVGDDKPTSSLKTKSLPLVSTPRRNKSWFQFCGGGLQSTTSFGEYQELLQDQIEDGFKHSANAASEDLDNKNNMHSIPDESALVTVTSQITPDDGKELEGVSDQGIEIKIEDQICNHPQRNTELGDGTLYGSDEKLLILEVNPREQEDRFPWEISDESEMADDTNEHSPTVESEFEEEFSNCDRVSGALHEAIHHEKKTKKEKEITTPSTHATLSDHNEDESIVVRPIFDTPPGPSELPEHEESIDIAVCTLDMMESIVLENREVPYDNMKLGIDSSLSDSDDESKSLSDKSVVAIGGNPKRRKFTVPSRDTEEVISKSESVVPFPTSEEKEKNSKRVSIEASQALENYQRQNATIDGRIKNPEPEAKKLSLATAKNYEAKVMNKPSSVTHRHTDLSDYADSQINQDKNVAYRAEMSIPEQGHNQHFPHVEKKLTVKYRKEPKHSFHDSTLAFPHPSERYESKQNYPPLNVARSEGEKNIKEDAKVISEEVLENMLDEVFDEINKNKSNSSPAITGSLRSPDYRFSAKGDGTHETTMLTAHDIPHRRGNVQDNISMTSKHEQPSRPEKKSNSPERNLAKGVLPDLKPQRLSSKSEQYKLKPEDNIVLKIQEGRNKQKRRLFTSQNPLATTKSSQTQSQDMRDVLEKLLIVLNRAYAKKEKDEISSIDDKQLIAETGLESIMSQDEAKKKEKECVKLKENKTVCDKQSGRLLDTSNKDTNRTEVKREHRPIRPQSKARLPRESEDAHSHDRQSVIVEANLEKQHPESQQHLSPASHPKQNVVLSPRLKCLLGQIQSRRAERLVPSTLEHDTAFSTQFHSPREDKPKAIDTTQSTNYDITQNSKIKSPRQFDASLDDYDRLLDQLLQQNKARKKGQSHSMISVDSDLDSIQDRVSTIRKEKEDVAEFFDLLSSGAVEHNLDATLMSGSSTHVEPLSISSIIPPPNHKSNKRSKKSKAPTVRREKKVRERPPHFDHTHILPYQLEERSTERTKDSQNSLYTHRSQVNSPVKVARGSGTPEENLERKSSSLSMAFVVPTPPRSTGETSKQQVSPSFQLPFVSKLESMRDSRPPSVVMITCQALDHFRHDEKDGHQEHDSKKSGEYYCHEKDMIKNSVRWSPVLVESQESRNLNVDIQPKGDNTWLKNTTTVPSSSALLSSPEKRRLLGQKDSDCARKLRRQLDLARLTTLAIRNSNQSLSLELEAFQRKLWRHRSCKQGERDILEACHYQIGSFQRQLRETQKVERGKTNNRWILDQGSNENINVNNRIINHEFTEIHRAMLTNLELLQQAKESWIGKQRPELKNTLNHVDEDILRLRKVVSMMNKI
jgi:hypothetical protein